MTRTRQERAKRVMLTLAGVCVVAAVAPAADQIVVNGWGGFLARPAGIGASEGDEPPAVAAPQEQDFVAPLPDENPPPPRPRRLRPPPPPVVAAPPMRVNVPRRPVVHRRR